MRPPRRGPHRWRPPGRETSVGRFDRTWFPFAGGRRAPSPALRATLLSLVTRRNGGSRTDDSPHADHPWWPVAAAPPPLRNGAGCPGSARAPGTLLPCPGRSMPSAARWAGCRRRRCVPTRPTSSGSPNGPSRAGAEGPGDVDRIMLRRYLAYLATRRYAKASIARIAASLRSYFQWCATRGLVAADPSSRLSAPSPDSRLPRVLGHGELHRAVGAGRARRGADTGRFAGGPPRRRRPGAALRERIAGGRAVRPRRRPTSIWPGWS